MPFTPSRPQPGHAKNSFEQHMPALSLLTAPVEAVKQLAEHPTVRLPIWVSDQHIHVSTGGLPPTVGATCHTHKPRFQGQGSLSDLQEEKRMYSQRLVSSCSFHQDSKGSRACIAACPASPGSDTEQMLSRHGKLYHLGAGLLSGAT